MLRKTALMTELKRAAGEMIRLNARLLLKQVLAATRISMSPEEEDSFYRKVVKPMNLKVGDDGEVSVEFGRP